MAYEHPLAYLIGLEGIALLRAFNGEYDREFAEARIAEVRRLLDDESLTGVQVERVRADEAYRVWAPSYDEPRNGLFDFEEPVVREILDGQAKGVALDAACGTGRYAEYLVEQGHEVVGVDGSPEMLERARIRVPSADFRAGDLNRLPVDDDAVDIVVCSLALTHVPDLGPVMAEFARVLRPGGHLVISDSHCESVSLAAVPTVIGPDGTRGRLPGYRHLAGDYLRAALPLGFQVLRCEEPRLPEVPQQPASDDPGPWELWPWTLNRLVPEAARAVNTGRPVTIIWHFRLGADS
ncbi:class I SAM-dependent methyltransferase [Saccharopolyspora taberi]